MVLSCSLACILTVDNENESPLLLFFPGSPLAFELVYCLETEDTKYGLQIPEEYLLTQEKKEVVKLVI